MTKLTGKKRPTEVAVLAILNISIGVLYLVVGLYFDSVFHISRLNLVGAVLSGGMLVFGGILLFVFAYVLWNGKQWVDFLFLIFGLYFLMALGPYLEGTGAKALNPPLVYYFLAELFGFIYILLIGVFMYNLYKKPYVKAFFDKT